MLVGFGIVLAIVGWELGSITFPPDCVPGVAQACPIPAYQTEVMRIALALTVGGLITVVAGGLVAGAIYRASPRNSS